MRVLVRILIIGLIVGFVAFAEKAPIKYPETKKVDHVDDYHGTKVEDPYRWLEDMNSEATAQWVQAQNKVTDHFLANIPYRDEIRQRLKDLWNYERLSLPVKHGDYYIFRKNDGLQEQSVVYIQKGLAGKPGVLLDPNTFSKDGSVGLRGLAFSKDQKYFSYGISRGGSDWREYFVVELKSRKKLNDHVKWVKFSGMSWYKDGFFYSRYDEPEESEKLKARNLNQKLYYHQAGTTQAEDQLIYQDPEHPRRGFGAWVDEDETYLVINVWEGSADHELLYYKDLRTDSPVTPLIDQPLAHFNVVDEIDGRFLVQTDYEAPNYRLVCIDPKKPQRENWQVVIPESKNKLGRVSSVGGKLIASYLKDAYSAVTVFDQEGKRLYDVRLPGVGSVFGFGGKREDTEVFYVFSSFTMPSTIYRYNIKENKSGLFRKSKVKFDPDQYVAKQVFYRSKDGTRVPLFITHRRGLKLNGKNPTLLYAYGGFNASMRPRFSLTIIPLLENGGVYALACLRGGGEYGEEWHKAGMLEKKQNVFDDFIAAAEYLIRLKYTSPQWLAIQGGSNGGLLIGAVMNQRPELFGAAIPEVGVMDMLRFHKFTIGWAWASEYGSSEDPQQFEFLYKYSPLHNIRTGAAYPATLVTTADHDDRVFPAHSFKYISTLQEKYKGKNPVLIRIETKVGHSGGTTVSRAIEEGADILSFILYNMGIEPVFH
jgi:prolyl oligopeptidase